MRLAGASGTANPEERTLRSSQLIIDRFPGAAGAASEDLTGDGGGEGFAFERHPFGNFRPDFNKIPGPRSLRFPNPHKGCL